MFGGGRLLVEESKAPQKAYTEARSHHKDPPPKEER